MSKGLVCLAGSFIAAWLTCYCGYKAEFPYRSTGPDAWVWVVIIPLAIFLWVCCGFLFLGFAKEFEKSSFGKTGNSSSSTSNSSSSSTNQNSRKDASQLQSPDTFGNKTFKNIQIKNKIEDLEHQNNYYKSLNKSQDGSMYDSNINNNDCEIDRLKRAL